MATLKVYTNGISGYQHGVGNHQRAKRGDILGWTAATARRQLKWLWAVDSTALTGVGYAVTLTLRNCPETAADFHRFRRAWLKRVERMGAIRIHWVIEWTARGVPHLHAAVYFEEQLPREEWLAVHWMLAVGDENVTGLQGQDVKKISGALGWLKYLSKHAGRGASHYQRRGHPEGWDRTGRMWGHTGQWPVVEPIEIPGLAAHEFYRVRRIMRSWAVADARKAGDFKRVAYLRKAGRPDNEKESRYMGFSEWVPESVTLRLVEFLTS